MALNEQEEFELLSLERQRVTQEQKPQKVRGGDWGAGVAKILDRLSYGAGEKVTDATGSPELGWAANVATQAVPAFLAGGVGKAAAPALEAAASRVMQSAVKPTSKALANGDAAKAIDTMLSEGINATAAGAAKLRTMISKLKDEVGALIAQSPATVDRGYVYKELSKTLDDVTRKGAGYNADRGAVLKAWDEFKNHPLLDKFAEVDNMIPIQAADTVKRATQQSVKDAYGRVTSTPADDKAQMAIAAGLRKGMEAAEPAVGPKNAKLAEYINALHQIEPRAAAAANRDLGGLASIAPTPEQAMLMLADRNPWMKSLIARVLHSGRETIPENTARAAVVAGSYLSEQQVTPQ